LLALYCRKGTRPRSPCGLGGKRHEQAVVENGGKDRLSNLDTSIHLSVYGPRMQADPNTISILAMLSVLPDGFPNTGSGSAIDELQRHLPGDTHLREAILTMRRVSLLQLDVETNRLRMLAPIRDFCERRLETPEILRSGLTAFYTEMMNNFPDVTDSAGHAIIPAELGNMHAVFVEACKRRRGIMPLSVHVSGTRNGHSILVILWKR
jgi:hypothetical protein